MRVLRLIGRAVCFVLAIPFVIVLVSIGFIVRSRQNEEPAQDEAAALVVKEELDDAALEQSEDDQIRRWLEDCCPTQRARRIMRAYSSQRFRPTLPFILRRRRT